MNLPAPVKPFYETIEYEGDSLIRTLRVYCSNFDIGWHFHPEYEIGYIVQSDGIRFVGDTVEPYRPDDLIFIGPGLPHCWQNRRDAEHGYDACELLVVQFTRETFGETFLENPDCRSIDELLQRAERGLSYDGGDVPQIRRKLGEILDARGPLRVARLLECLHLLATTEPQRTLVGDSYSVERNLFVDERINLAVNYVLANLQGDLRQVDVARHIGMSPQAFSRFFRVATGSSFSQFVNNVRIALVCRKLINSDDNISRIAFACGYSNLSNFNRRFLAAKKVSPRDYRRMYRDRLSPRHSGAVDAAAGEGGK